MCPWGLCYVNLFKDSEAPIGEPVVFQQWHNFYHLPLIIFYRFIFNFTNCDVLLLFNVFRNLIFTWNIYRQLFQIVYSLSRFWFCNSLKKPEGRNICIKLWPAMCKKIPTSRNGSENFPMIPKVRNGSQNSGWFGFAK